jgi:hypothetical protein
VACTVDRAPREAPRPLTFAWNGGPGSNALLLLLRALGPRRLTDDGEGGGHAGPIALEDKRHHDPDERDWTVTFFFPAALASRPGTIEQFRDRGGSFGIKPSSAPWVVGTNVPSSEEQYRARSTGVDTSASESVSGRGRVS